MKKIMYLLCLPLMLSLASCGGAQPENTEEKEKEAAETKVADSLTTEMDKTQGEIEAKSTELNDALKALENK